MRKRQLPTFKAKEYMHWRGHPMVARLQGSPLIIKASSSMFGKNDQSILGNTTTTAIIIIAYNKIISNQVRKIFGLSHEVLR